MIIVPHKVVNLAIWLVAVYTQLGSVRGDDHEDVCLLYSKKNFSGEPILSLRPSIKVFQTPLIFQLPSSSKGIDISSVKLLKSACSVILCNGKHLKGDCTEISETTQDLSKSIDLSTIIHKNVLSVDCHCPEASSVGNESKETEEVSGSSLQESTLALPSTSDKVKSLQAQPCATLFRDWHYKGQKYPVMFPGSAGPLGLGIYDDDDRFRSVSIKTGCNLVLWGNSVQYSGEEGHPIRTFSLNKSTSFLQLNRSNSYEWVCCYCDQCSEAVCNNAQSSSQKLPGESMSTESEDFSQFVKYGKKIIGIGRNYRWKKVELAKVLSVPKEPIVFLKPTTSYIKEGDLIELPESLGTIFYELELGIVIGKRGKNVSEVEAMDHVAGYFLALDMTAKEFIKGKGNQSHPWEIGKGFDTACPVGDFIPKNFLPDPNNILLECKVNGEITQSENTSQMIFNVRQLISYISKYMTLEPYDTILTGTPDGFGPVKMGDVIEGRLGNLTSINFSVVLSPL